MRGRSLQVEGYARFAVRGANDGPAGDRAFSHVFREGGAGSRIAAWEQASRLRKRLSLRLQHAEHSQKADHARHGNVIATPSDAAVRLQNLRQRRRERGAQDAAEIVSAGRACVSDGDRKELRQERSKWREGETHRAQREREEGEDAECAAREESGHGQSDSDGDDSGNEEHRPPAKPVGERGGKRRRERNEDNRPTQQSEKVRARDPERPHAIAEHINGRDIEERVTDDDRERPLDQRGQMVAQDGGERNVAPPILIESLERRRLLERDAYIESDRNKNGAQEK